MQSVNFAALADWLENRRVIDIIIMVDNDKNNVENGKQPMMEEIDLQNQ